MCNHCSNQDPRDTIHTASRALSAFLGLLYDIDQTPIGAAPGQFDATTPGKLLALLEPVERDVRNAADALQNYIYRDPGAQG
jgi:hypothetical protein